jgi:hypothetical protein
MRFLISLILTLAACGVYAQDVRTFVPAQAYGLLPQVRQAQLEIWPDAPMPSFLAAQIEQESCISLRHSRCWNTRAQLKTSREFGFGLGQTTIAYRPDGSVRFNKQAELRDTYASLRGWTDDKRFDAHYQITAIVEMDRGIYSRILNVSDTTERLAFTLSAYNGGESGVRQDRLLCRNTPGCNPNLWFKHVEHHSLKTRKVNPGYGKSAFEINREYPRNVLFLRRPKYQPFFESAR